MSAPTKTSPINTFMEPGGPPATIAHRGFSSCFPENTLLALAEAAQLQSKGRRVDMVEFDVTLSADGKVVVIHDQTLDRTTSGTGNVSDHDLLELRALDASSWFTATNPNKGPFEKQQIPTLEEVLDLFAPTDLLLNVEIKGEAITNPPPGFEESHLVDEVANLLESHEFENRTVISSFEPRALLLMRERAPDLTLASLFNPKLHRDLGPEEVAGAVGSKGINIEHGLVDLDLIQRCHKGGLKVAAFTVDDDAIMRRLIEMGIDGLFTNRPDLMLQVLDDLDGRS